MSKFIIIAPGNEISFYLADNEQWVSTKNQALQYDSRTMALKRLSTAGKWRENLTALDLGRPEVIPA